MPIDLKVERPLNLGSLGDISPMDKLRAFADSFADRTEDCKIWDYPMVPHHLIPLSATMDPVPTTYLKFTVLPQYCNGMNNLHGGATATLFDLATSSAIALVSKPGFWNYPGVSRTLNCTYLQPIPVGTEMIIKSEVISIGKRMCTIRGTGVDKNTGKVLIMAEHGKNNQDDMITKALASMSKL